MAANWRLTLFNALKDFDAPRVLSNQELMDFSVAATGETVSLDKMNFFIQQAVTFDALLPVRRGIYINLKSTPTPSLAEVATRIRANAVVSLQSVLGDAGVLNNYTGQIFCLLPIAPNETVPSLGTIEARDGTIFHFKGIKKSILEAGDPMDRLVPMLTYERATPEAAIVHWIYLAHTQRSQLVEPDTQCDLASIDIDRLERLATAAGVNDKVMDWVQRVQEREELDDNEVGWGP